MLSLPRVLGTTPNCCGLTPHGCRTLDRADAHASLRSPGTKTPAAYLATRVDVCGGGFRALHDVGPGPQRSSAAGYYSGDGFATKGNLSSDYRRFAPARERFGRACGNAASNG